MLVNARLQKLTNGQLETKKFLKKLTKTKVVQKTSVKGRRDRPERRFTETKVSVKHICHPLAYSKH